MNGANNMPVTAIGILSTQKIGELSGFVKIPYESGVNTVLDYLTTGYYHIHGKSFVYPEYADNILLTADAGVWSQGGQIIEVIPAGAMGHAFDLHFLNVENISANGVLQVDIYAGLAGSEIVIGSTKPHRNVATSQENSRRIQIPQQKAGTRISCMLSDSTAGAITCRVSFEGHFYGVVA